ncbi:hypothetical protein [Halorarius litoreus]|uniref:hypothetical protein n=1 Tax=Halorarius litoreus TaxID=2962676 RepID=UPI0020CC7336|nr:hypothetical protein [Halorarius litoreus]
MTDVLAAKRALARLADPSPVVEAEYALRDLDHAAAFRAAGGVARLRRVAARDDHATRGDGHRAQRARAAIAAFERFEAAAAGQSLEATTETHRSSARTAPPRTDHFRRGRDTPLPDGG